MPRTRLAFLRGINVGGHRLTMEELRAALSPVGLQNVRTFIASGNVAFGADPRSAADLEAAIGKQLQDALGYEVDTFIREIPELERVAEFARSQVELMPGEGWKPHVIFMHTAPSSTVEASLRQLETPEDVFPIREREIIWLRRGGMLDSSISANDLARALERKTNTARTLKTVQRILAKFSG